MSEAAQAIQAALNAYRVCESTEARRQAYELLESVVSLAAREAWCVRCDGPVADERGCITCHGDTNA